MPRDTSKHIHPKAEAEYRLGRGEELFMVKGNPSKLHSVLYKFLVGKRGEDVSLSKDNDGVWIRRRS